MPVRESNIYTITFSKDQVKNVINNLANSSFLFEALNPVELEGQWKNVHFLSPEYEKQNELNVLKECVEYYEPKKSILSIFDKRINITNDDLKWAELNSKYTFEVCKNLVEYKKIHLEIKEHSQPYKDEVKLASLQNYFNTENIHPNNLDTENYKKILAFYTVLEYEKELNNIAELVFNIGENSTTTFLFLAVDKGQSAEFETFLNEQNILFEPVEWSEKIIHWVAQNKHKPFQKIIQKVGIINEGDINPTFVISIFSTLFLGFAFPDGLYGLITAMVTGYLYFFTNLKEKIRNIIFILFTGSLVSILFGFITNSWAGNLFNNSLLKIIFNVKNEDSLAIIQFTRSFQLVDFGFFSTPNNTLFANQFMGNLNPILLIFFAAITAGFFTFIVIFLIKLFRSSKKGNILEIFENLNWFTITIFLLVTIIGFLNNTPWKNITLLAVSVLIILFFIFNESKSITGKITVGLRKVYALGKILKGIFSFSSLAIIALMCYIFAATINLAAELIITSNVSIFTVIAAFLVIILGHILNLLLTLFIAYLNTLYLLRVEIIPHFLNKKVRGRNFKPLTGEFKYTKII